MAQVVEVENLGVTGWLGSTVEKGGQALCATICGCIMIPTAIALVFFGEYNYVKDLNNIYHIKKDIVDVTSYDPANDGKPVAYYGEAVASSLEVPTWGFTIPASFEVSWSGQIYRYTKATTEANNQKTTTYTPGWSSTKGEVYTDTKQNTYNTPQWTAPCQAGASGSASCSGHVTQSNFNVGNWTGQTYLASYYTGHTTATTLTADMFTANCTACKQYKWVSCSNYLSNNADITRNPSRCAYPGMGSPTAGDQYVPFSYYPSNVMVTVCSRQESDLSGHGTWKELFSSGSYDIMAEGKKTSDDCIDIMNAQASGTVFIFRIIGFGCFWCGFVLLLSFVEFMADRIGQLIPCGLGEAFEEMIQCLICMVTCPPACMCWLFWFALAWLLFRPLIGGPLVVVALCGFGGMYYWNKQNQEKQASANAYAPLNSGTVGYQPPQQQQQNYPQQQQQQNYPQQQQQQNYPQMNQPVQPGPPMQQQQQPNYPPQQQQPPNQQYQPQPAYQQPQAYQPQPNYQPNNVAPPPNYAPQTGGMIDANMNGIPDQYETNLPPGFEARMDATSQRVYWVNHNNNTSTWQDPRV